MNTSTKTRFDTRIPQEQKDFFQHAADLGGFRTLTDFVIHSARVQAEMIVRKHELVLASEKDSKIFFQAIAHPPAANARLKKAAKKYNESVGKK